jgi:hypothetical protein
MEGSLVIYVAQEQLDQVEYLISQSKLGNHILFSPEELRRVFASQHSLSIRDADAAEFQEEEAYSVEHHIERIIAEPTFERKRAYLDQLDSATFEKVVRTYFHIVENNLYEEIEVRH